MIKRINTLKHIGRFVELRGEQGQQGEFSELNIIYAKNGCGKSTLCDVLRSLTTGESSYLIGRQRLGSANPPEVFVVLSDSATRRRDSRTVHGRMETFARLSISMTTASWLKMSWLGTTSMLISVVGYMG